MKNTKDIEKKLKDGKLPDTDVSGIQYEVWQKILDKKRKQRKLSFLSRMTPWVWAIASIILILLCILLMIYLNYS